MLKNIIKIIECAEQSKISNPTIRRRLRCIDDEIIIDEIGMANLPLILMLMHIKYKKNLRLISMGQDTVIRAGRHDIARTSYLAVQLHFLEMQKNRLIIEGVTSLPSVFGDESGFLIVHNGNPISCDLIDKGFDQKIGKIVYEKRRVFRAEIIPSDGKNVIQFANVIQLGQEYICPYGKINAMRFFPVSDCLEHQYSIQNGYVFYLKNGNLCFERTDETERSFYEELYQEELSQIGKDEAEWAIHLRQRYFEIVKKKNKPIWIFMDRPNQADDNAEILFRYVRNNEKFDSYYIISEDSEDYKRLKDLGHVVPLYSPEHELLALLADYVISSQANGIVENPFWEKAEYIRDLYHHPKIIFLQHGVIKDDMSPTLNRYDTNFTGFVTSSPAERESILQGEYDYSEEKVWLTGLPRFDRLYNDPKNYLLIMPSWRKEFVEQAWDNKTHNMVWRPKEGFAESLYVRTYRSLLNNKRLLEACESCGYRILFIPHALMKPYVEDLMGDAPVQNKPYREIFAESNIIVTDYSSVAFDFAYLQKPIVYYQFDRETFFSTHTYQKGYFDYERDGFGEVLTDEESLVTLLIDYMKNGCVTKENYRQRMETVFAYRDGKACERVIQFIRNDMDNGEYEKQDDRNGEYCY